MFEQNVQIHSSIEIYKVNIIFSSAANFANIHIFHFHDLEILYLPGGVIYFCNNDLSYFPGITLLIIK